MFQLKMGLRLFTVATLVWAAGASAQVYVGGSLGTAKPNLSCRSETPCNQSESAFKLIGGYTIDKNFAIEVNYANLGGQRFRYADHQTTSDFRVDTRAASLAALANFDFTDKLSGFTKLGYARLRSEEKFTANGTNIAQNTASTVTYEGAHALLGIGLRYNISDRLSLRTEVEQFHFNKKRGHSAFRAVTVGVQYSF